MFAERRKQGLVRRAARPEQRLEPALDPLLELERIVARLQAARELDRELATTWMGGFPRYVSRRMRM
jgi:hypothetical protein